MNILKISGFSSDTIKVKKTDLPVLPPESDILPSLDDTEIEETLDEDEDDIEDDEDMLADEAADSDDDDDYDSDEDVDIDRENEDDLGDNWDSLSTPQIGKTIIKEVCSLCLKSLLFLKKKQTKKKLRLFLYDLTPDYIHHLPKHNAENI